MLFRSKLMGKKQDEEPFKEICEDCDCEHHSILHSALETKMRSMAKEVGCKTMNGLGMMLFQGAAAFKLWTGKDMPIEHMKEVLNIRYDD